MTESLSIRKFFERNWERMILWVILIGLFYLLKPFFLIIFETFLITYITKNIVMWVVQKTKLRYETAVFIVFASLLGIIIFVGVLVGPKLIIESSRILNDFAGDKQGAQQKIDDFAESLVIKVVGEAKGQLVIGSEEYSMIMVAIRDKFSYVAKSGLPQILQYILYAIRIGWEILVSLLLSMIFSFILVRDWQKISEKMKQLEKSRIRTFYIGSAPHLVAFADVLGKAFRAQAIIAICNTFFTAVGLWYFGVPNVAILSTIVFFCGFIPILGTFMSSIPIMIFAIHAGGLALVFKLVLFIAVIHAFEAYVLNPKITGSVLRVHPILILMLLLIGERFFGIWGMVVGVPIGCYVLSVLAQKDEHFEAGAPEENPESANEK